MASGLTMGSPPGTGGACSQWREDRSGQVRRQIAQDGLHVRDVAHVLVRCSGVVPLVAGAGAARGVGPRHADVGTGSLSHVDAEDR